MLSTYLGFLFLLDFFLTSQLLFTTILGSKIGPDKSPAEEVLNSRSPQFIERSSKFISFQSYLLPMLLALSVAVGARYTQSICPPCGENVCNGEKKEENSQSNRDKMFKEK